jgi:hypothetical protein
MLSRIEGSGARLQGSLPRVRNLPARNAAFTGRDSLLVHFREASASGQRVAVQALHGRGGAGKTQLAIDYAYRFASDDGIAWWIAAEDPALIPDRLAASSRPDHHRARGHIACCRGRAVTGIAGDDVTLFAGIPQR